MPERAAAAASMTPMMAQFFEIKAVNPGYLLFYRMGDFYELFFDDAEIASEALGIVLTKRGKHLGDDIPMCGVPIHAAQDYLKKLIAAGHRVAVCEQVEDPAEAKKRGSKSVVKRDVVRLVTAGTLTEDDLLPARANNFLACLAMIRHGETDFALAWADISTGESWVIDCDRESLADELARIDPAELVLSALTRETLRRSGHSAARPRRASDRARSATFRFRDRRRSDLRETFADLDPTAFTRAAPLGPGRADRLCRRDARRARRIALRPPQAERRGAAMAIDQATRLSLELLVTNRGETRGSLRQAIDMTVTSAGSRLLARRLAAPLADAEAINERLDMVEAVSR